MSLTPLQLAARKGKLTASRVAVLMTADKEGIMRLYREMIGEIPEENLDDVWAVQLGSTTEKLNLDWYERKNNVVLQSRGEVWFHKEYHWAAATLDGWDPNLNCPVECKHTGGREPLEVLIDRYQPQMQWQMACTRAETCGFSVILGAKEPIVEYIDVDHAYGAEMIARGERFMMCVDMKMPPIAEKPAGPPVVPNTVRNMTGNNSWAAHAADWLNTRQEAETHKDCEKILKAMVQPEDKKCFGNGIRITRDRAGRLSLRADE